MKKSTSILLVLAVVCLFFGYKNYTHTEAFVGDAKTIDGTVIELVKNKRVEGSVEPTNTAEQTLNVDKSVAKYDTDSSKSEKVIYTYSPKIRFTGLAGEIVTFTSPTSSNPAKFEVGEIVPIIYDVEHPEDARINTKFGVWGSTLMLWTLAGILVLICLVNSFIAVRRQSVGK